MRSVIDHSVGQGLLTEWDRQVSKGFMNILVNKIWDFCDFNKEREHHCSPASGRKSLALKNGPQFSEHLSQECSGAQVHKQLYLQRDSWSDCGWMEASPLLTLLWARLTLH